MNLCELLVNFVISLIASLVGVWLALRLEGMKRPNLKITKCEPDPQQLLRNPNLTRLHVHVENLALPNLLTQFWNRETAVGCRAWITFYKDDKSPFKLKILARWKEAEVPQIPEFWIKEKRLPKGLQETIDIQPTDSERSGEKLDIAVKFKKREDARYIEEEECYAWNNENYLYEGDENVMHRHPDHKLEAGVYYVRVVVVSGGRQFKELFKLHNETGKKFELQTIDNEQEKDELMKLLERAIAKPS
jgi:hypothetical protein